MAAAGRPPGELIQRAWEEVRLARLLFAKPWGRPPGEALSHMDRAASLLRDALAGPVHPEREMVRCLQEELACLGLLVRHAALLNEGWLEAAGLAPGVYTPGGEAAAGRTPARLSLDI